MSTPRYCATCLHATGKTGKIKPDADIYCNRPMAANPVTGDRPKMRLCAVERDRSGGCGVIGRYWQAVEVVK